MKCILLCAGYATRLFPLTENFPKALLEIGEKPLLDYILNQVNELDEVDEIYLVTNNRYYEHFLNWSISKGGKKITVLNDNTVSNDDRLGAIGDIKYTIDTMKIDDDLLIIAGDNLFTFSLKDMVKVYNENKKPMVAAKEINDKNILKGLAVVTLDENENIESCIEKPEEPKGNIGLYAEYIYPKDVVKLFDKYIEEGNNKDAPGNFIVWLYKETKVGVFLFEGECYDVGTHESLREVNKIYSKEK